MQIPYAQAMKFDGDTDSLAGLKEVLRTVRAGTLEFLGSLSEEELATPAPFPERWFESLRLPSVPLSEAFRSIAQHEWYHTGQLVSYLWARGDDPYKW
ncbi:MAG: DinB family protein [Fimbriimonadaceae bacterium]